MKSLIFVCLLTFFSVLTLINCRKDKRIFDTTSSLSFSADTVLFDTLFTTIGSTTKRFKIYNSSNKKIKISSIQLGQGTKSMFRINVDGLSGVSFNDIEIPEKDSLFVFVEVTIDPNNATTPIIVEDKINFITNGTSQQVVLNAFGQDAYFHVREIITTSITWPNDKPHVIYGFLAVDSAKSLTIQAGTKVHAFNNSFLYVYKSSLNVQGNLGNEVSFSQSRSEDFILANADSVAGQWRGIYFFAPKNSKIEYATIKNATIGIQIDTISGMDSVILENVFINNSSFASIVTQGGNVYANSCVFGSAGSYSSFLSIGGNLYFDHCTFANYWQGQRNTVLFALKDYYETNSGIQYRPFSKAVFKNNIFYGNNKTELGIDTLSRTLTNINPNFKFINCLVKTEDNINTNSYFVNSWNNLDPGFSNTLSWNYRTNNNVNVNQKGGSTNPINDLDGNPRASSGNDLGAYNTP